MRQIAILLGLACLAGCGSGSGDAPLTTEDDAAISATQPSAPIDIDEGPVAGKTFISTRKVRFEMERMFDGPPTCLLQFRYRFVKNSGVDVDYRILNGYAVQVGNDRTYLEAHTDVSPDFLMESNIAQPSEVHIGRVFEMDRRFVRVLAKPDTWQYLLRHELSAWKIDSGVVTVDWSSLRKSDMQAIAVGADNASEDLIVRSPGVLEDARGNELTVSQ